MTTIKCDDRGLLFPTVKDVKEYAKENGYTVCSCWWNYPNPSYRDKLCGACFPVSCEGFDTKVQRQYCLKKKGECNNEI